jgi:biopolymer transport protein ExbB/TolQ
MNLAPVLLAAASGADKLSLPKIWNLATVEAKIIIIILVVFSIFAWSTMAAKAIQMHRAKRLNLHFSNEFRTSEGVLSIYDRHLEVQGCPLYAVYQDGCQDIEGRLKQPDGSRKKLLSLKAAEHVKRALEGAVARESLHLESGLVILSIAVSGAPFLGLLGTVWGVMDAFGGVAAKALAGSRADLGAMAPGVAAALITTIAGLLVAIPSMFAYNWLIHSLRVLTVELDNFAQSLASRMETEFLKDDE